MFSRKSDNRQKSVMWYYFQLLLHPRDTIAKIVADQISVKRIAIVLAVVGLLRGLVEGMWIYAMQGKMSLLFASLHHADWYWVNGLPFLLCNIPSTHFLWFGIAFCLFATGRLLGGQGKFVDVARVFGVAMVNYVVIGLLNYTYLVVKAPALTLFATNAYSPKIGVGQFVVLGWWVYLMYLIGRQVLGLGKTSSWLVAPLPITTSLVFFCASAVVFFQVLSWLPKLTRWQTFMYANYVYTGVILLFIPIFFWLGHSTQKWLRGWSVGSER